MNEFADLARRLQDNDESVLVEILRVVIPPIWKVILFKPPHLNVELAITQSEVQVPNTAIEDIIAQSLAQLWSERSKIILTEYDLSGHLYMILRKIIRKTYNESK